MYMRRHDEKATVPNAFSTSNHATCVVKPINPHGFSSLEDLENTMAFGIFALVDLEEGTECVLNTETVFQG